MTSTHSSGDVWLLWSLEYNEAAQDYSRILHGVYATREAAERDQVLDELAEFELDRREPLQ